MAEYIEREAAIEAVKHAWAKGLEPSQYIEIIPAADVTSVRHGRWIDKGEYAVCMECKNDKSGRTTETAEPQPDGIQFRTVDDLGRICIPKDIRDKLGIKPGTACAVYATDELTNEEIIVIRRK